MELHSALVFGHRSRLRFRLTRLMRLLKGKSRDYRSVGLGWDWLETRGRRRWSQSGFTESPEWEVSVKVDVVN